jgi:hypothetical protein
MRLSAGEFVFVLFFDEYLSFSISTMKFPEYSFMLPRSPQTLSGGPRILSFETDVKYTVWTASDYNGRIWPPVIFATKWSLSADDVGLMTHCCWYNDGENKEHSAYVHIVDKAAPNYTHTLQWLADMRCADWCWMEEGTHLVLDRAPWHMEHHVSEYFKQNQNTVVPHLLPGGAGKWLNPQDQAIHALIRKKWRALSTSSLSQDAERHLIAACFAPSKDTVAGAWRHTALIEGNAKTVIEKRNTEGYHAPKGKKDVFKKYRSAFSGWESNSVRRSADTLPDEQPATLPGTQLDGRKWVRYGNSKDIKE